MKALFFTSLLILAALFGFGQDTSAPRALDTTKVTFSTVYKDAKYALIGLGSALKVGGEHVYSVLVKQQIVNSISWIIVMLITVLMLTTSFQLNKSADWEGGNLSMAGTLILGIVGIILLVVTLCNIGVVVTGFVNPEYGALKDIMNFIRPKK